MFKSIKNKLSGSNKKSSVIHKHNNQHLVGINIPPQRPPQPSKSALKRIQHSMGNIASSLLVRHHSIGSREKLASLLMASLSEMRAKREGCDIMIEDCDIIMHTIVASYSEHLLQMCEDIKAANDDTEDVLAKDEKTDFNEANDATNEIKSDAQLEATEKIKEDKTDKSVLIENEAEIDCVVNSNKMETNFTDHKIKTEVELLEINKGQKQDEKVEFDSHEEVYKENEINQDLTQKKQVEIALHEEVNEEIERNQDMKRKNEEIDLNQEVSKKEEQNNQTLNQTNKSEIESPKDINKEDNRKNDQNSCTEESNEIDLEHNEKHKTSVDSKLTTEENQKKQENDTKDSEKIIDNNENDVENQSLKPENDESSLEYKKLENKKDESDKHIQKDKPKISKNYQIISDIVNFLYDSRIRIDAQNVDQILETSRKCKLNDIVAACERFKLAGNEIDDVISNDDAESPVISQGQSQDPFIYEDPLFPLKMLDHFNDLRLKRLYCDCEINFKIVSETKPPVPKLNCHRVLLSAVSPYYKTLLAKNEEPIFSDNDFPVGTLNKCLMFFYTGNIKVASTSVQKLIRAAQLVGSKELIDCCGEILETTLNNENCIVLRQLAIENGSEALEVSANNWICQNFNAVTKTQVFKDLNVEVAEQILKSDAINLEFPLSEGEMVVFRACVRWLKENYESRKAFSERILSTVRYPLIDIQHLLNDISVDQCVIESDVISSHIANVMASKNSHLPIRSSMRGVPYVVTCGGSAIVEDVTSENQDYTPVGYYHKMTLYDTGLNKFHDWTSLPESRSLHCAVVVDQYLFIIGGYDPFSCISGEVHYLDMSSGKWNKGPEMKTKRVLFTAHLINNCIYVVGGLGTRGYLSSVEKLDISTMTWHKSVSLPSTRYRFCLFYCIQI